MSKKWKKGTLVVTGIALLANPYTLQVFGINSHAEEIYYSTDNDLYDTQLKEAKKLVKKAKESWVEEDIKKAIDTLLKLPYSKEYKYDEKKKLINEMFDFVNKIDDSSLKTKYGIYFTEATINRAKDTLINPDYELAVSVVTTLPDGKLKTKYVKSLDSIKDKIDEEYWENAKDIILNNGEGQTPPLDWSKMPDDAFAPYENTDTGDYLPGFPLPEKEPTKPNKDALPEENYTEEMKYQTIGQSCYKVTTRTVEGKKAVTIKELVTGIDATFCSVLVIGSHSGEVEAPYDFNKVDPAPPASGENINGGSTESNSYFGYSDNASENQEDATLSNLTLQFTLDKTEKEPYFYETDMNVSKDGTITYQQQRDVLFQLAIRSGGKAVEDKNRFLVLLENKIVVVENKGDKIPVSTFEVILKDFKAEVKAMERKVGQ